MSRFRRIPSAFTVTARTHSSSRDEYGNGSRLRAWRSWPTEATPRGAAAGRPLTEGDLAFHPNVPWQAFENQGGLGPQSLVPGQRAGLEACINSPLYLPLG